MTYERRGEPLTKPCLMCGTIITRPYKMTLNRWNERKFCSQKCNGASTQSVFRGTRPQWTDEQRASMSQRMMGKKYALGYQHTDKAKQTMSIKRRGARHWMWREDAATYSAFHKWLVNNFGCANCCENKFCNSGVQKFEYALLKNKTHAHLRENYITLCVPCHRSYDTHGRIRFKL